ncbi:hypothetical protein EC968_005638 [Mortierella alpina]|nr:hypothetical protein EC968_005638 [Mortierella alpina]
MSSRSHDPSTYPVSNQEVPSGTLLRLDKKQLDGIHSIRKWIVVFGAANTIAIVTAQTISLRVNDENTPKIGPITVQLLIVNIVLVASTVFAMKQSRRRSEPFGPLVGRAYISRIVFAVIVVGVLFIYAVVPIDGMNLRRKEDTSSPATSPELVGGAAIAILYVASGLQVILGILVAMEQYMGIKLRRSEGLSESQPQNLYIYQPAIPLRSDFSHSHRNTRIHYVGDEEDVANKDALPAYERERPEDHLAVHIIDMADSALYIQQPQEPTTTSPPDYENDNVASSETPPTSTAAPVIVESEVRPQVPT